MRSVTQVRPRPHARGAQHQRYSPRAPGLGARFTLPRHRHAAYGAGPRRRRVAAPAMRPTPLPPGETICAACHRCRLTVDQCRDLVRAIQLGERPPNYDGHPLAEEPARTSRPCQRRPGRLGVQMRPKQGGEGSPKGTAISRRQLYKSARWAVGPYPVLGGRRGGLSARSSRKTAPNLYKRTSPSESPVIGWGVVPERLQLTLLTSYQGER